MKKTFLAISALAAMLFAGCTSSDELTTLESIKTADNTPTPVQFGTYMGRTTTTRAGLEGAITTEVLKTAGDAYGFGVFAYYTNDGDYAGTSKPNFMYNQHVTWNSSNWEYTPVKYWPNEFGASAVSTGIDKLSFFAYAPFVDNTPNSGAITTPGTYGIIKFVERNNDNNYSNTSTGDPRIKYAINNDPTHCVDLLWGVANIAEDYEIANSATTTIGLPWLDVTKQKTNGKIDILFKHALAKLTFNVDVDVDDVRDETSDHSNALATGTKIFVRQVTISGKIAREGYLNLNNTTANTPLWEIENGTAISPSQNTTYTFYDGRSDGYEGYADADATHPGANAGELVGLNSVLIQSATTGDAAPYTLSTNAGVTKTAVPLLTNDGVFYVIPTDPSNSDGLTVQIIYDVLTTDDRLYGDLADGKIKGSLVKNNITKTAALTIEAGKAYTVNLHLGMTSVKMDATVSTWTVATSDVDLPVNEAVPAP